LDGASVPKRLDAGPLGGHQGPPRK
jgi:hypothetical protein